jgi:hypothetical protein
MLDAVLTIGDIAQGMYGRFHCCYYCVSGHQFCLHFFHVQYLFILNATKSKLELLLVEFLEDNALRLLISWIS